MKIVFLCGSLVKGHDGVGDYTRMLAFELIKKGHNVGVVSLNDSNIRSVINIVEDEGEFRMPVLQIPSDLPANQRYSLAADWVNKFNPDWVSLQFVIYSFHPKGLPFKLGEKLKNITAGRKMHVMFHEIWIGFTKISPLKHKLTGKLQQRIIHSIINVLKPDKISTTNYLYHLVLKDKKIDSDIIPLFSNIPIAAQTSAERSEQLAILNIRHEEREEYLITGIFGNLYPEANLQQIISNQLVEANEKDKKLVFLGFGRINNDGQVELKRLKAFFSGSVPFFHLGEVSAEMASQLFQIMDSAISCTPSQHIGKSGVFAALKLHGVPVVLSNGDYIPEYHQRSLNYYECFVNRPPEVWSVSAVSELYISYLT